MNILKNRVVFLLLLIIVLLVLNNFIFSNTKPTQVTKYINYSTPTPYQTSGKINIETKTIFKPLAPESIPTRPLEQGGGINSDSRPIKDSENEIKKLQPFLPFKKDYKLSTGLNVSVVIPSQTTQPWILTVQIYNINYKSNTSDIDYNFMKRSFKEASEDVFVWALDQGVDLNKVLIDWGGREFIQNQADKWLKEP
ncbi:hypothetical protein C4577_07810 [Candidatus Parcubacteria bacterium]|nr:MAG: hypothetical protein C4577_07810 [Candidatus Parcubacteria bacterium]